MRFRHKRVPAGEKERDDGGFWAFLTPLTLIHPVLLQARLQMEFVVQSLCGFHNGLPGSAVFSSSISDLLLPKQGFGIYRSWWRSCQFRYIITDYRPPRGGRRMTGTHKVKNETIIKRDANNQSGKKETVNETGLG